MNICQGNPNLVKIRHTHYNVCIIWTQRKFLFREIIENQKKELVLKYSDVL